MSNSVEYREYTISSTTMGMAENQTTQYKSTLT